MQNTGILRILFFVIFVSSFDCCWARMPVDQGFGMLSPYGLLNHDSDAEMWRSTVEEIRKTRDKIAALDGFNDSASLEKCKHLNTELQMHEALLMDLKLKRGIIDPLSWSDWKNLIRRNLLVGTGGAEAPLQKALKPLGDRLERVSKSFVDRSFDFLGEYLAPILLWCGFRHPVEALDFNAIYEPIMDVAEILSTLQKAGDASFAMVKAINIRKDQLQQICAGAQDFADDEDVVDVSQDAKKAELFAFCVKGTLLDFTKDAAVHCRKAIFKLKFAKKRYAFDIARMSSVQTRIKTLLDLIQQSSSVLDLIKDGHFYQIKSICTGIKSSCVSVSARLFSDKIAAPATKNRFDQGGGYGGYGYGEF